MLGEYWIQPDSSFTFHLMVHFSHYFMDISNWIPHLHLKINMLHFWSFSQANSSLGCPPFLSPTILPNTLPCPLRLLSRKRASVIFASSAPVCSFSLPSQPSLRLGASREPPTQSLGSTLTLSGLSSALLQSSTSVMLLSCGKPFCGLTLHSSSFRLLYNMILNDYIRSSLLLDTSPIFWSNCPGYHF